MKNLRLEDRVVWNFFVFQRFLVNLGLNYH